MATETSPKFLAVDFYCGAGGTTRGLIDAGGYVIAGVDNDATCEETYTNNNPNCYLDLKSPDFLRFDMFPATDDYPQGQQDKIFDKLGEAIPRYRKMSPDSPLLFAICAPCQSFTKFVQRNMTQERADARVRDQNLLAQTVSFIEEFRPEMLIAENVANSFKRYESVWTDFKSELARLGYTTGEDVVCASRFGVPQFRKRFFLMGIKVEDDAEMLLGGLSVPSEDPEMDQVTVQEAIGYLDSLEAGAKSESDPNHMCRNLSELNRHRLMSVRPGEPNFGFSESSYGDISLACHRRLADKGQRGFGDVYTRMRPDRPSPTITTRFHSVSNGRFGHYDDAQIRGLSLREGAILQSFPGCYEFFGRGFDQIAAMIGNAVPPKMASFMADWLYGVWIDRTIEAEDGSNE